MHVCVCVCVYVCMYVRTYVCMYVRMYVRTYVVSRDTVVNIKIPSHRRESNLCVCIYVSARSPYKFKGNLIEITINTEHCAYGN
jgi:hypothetical protein